MSFVCVYSSSGELLHKGLSVGNPDFIPKGATVTIHEYVDRGHKSIVYGFTWRRSIDGYFGRLNPIWKIELPKN